MFSQNYEGSALRNDPNSLGNNQVRPITQEEQTRMTRSNSSWCYQFSLLAQRNFINIMRLPQTSYVKLVVTILTALFCVVLFMNVG